MTEEPLHLPYPCRQCGWEDIWQVQLDLPPLGSAEMTVCVRCQAADRKPFASIILSSSMVGEDLS